MHRQRSLALTPVLVALVAAIALGVAAQTVARAAARSATTPDYQAIARLMVRDAVAVKDKDAVLILGDKTKIPLMEALAVEVAKAGGYPHMVLDSPEAANRILTEVPLSYLESPNKMMLNEVKKIDVLIALSAVDDPATFARVPEERVALARKSGQEIGDTINARPIRTVALGNPLMPTPAVARHYGVPLETLEAQFWDSVNAPHAEIEATGNLVRQALTGGRAVRITTPAGTDLRLSLLPDRKILLSDGRIHAEPAGKPEEVWLPAGEVFTAPDATSANGTVVVPLADYRGIKIRNLRLTFTNGRVTNLEATQNAEALKAALAQSSGDKDLFAFLDIGVNPRSKRIPNSDYATFPMAGMVTIGIGQAPWAESPNQSEFGQEFFIPGATLEVDGRSIVKSGKLAI
jgi:leucyl aminopeptidase (aminopeptidase T)